MNFVPAENLRFCPFPRPISCPPFCAAFFSFYFRIYVITMEKISTPAVASATILAILVLALCLLFVMRICSLPFCSSCHDYTMAV